MARSCRIDDVEAADLAGIGLHQIRIAIAAGEILAEDEDGALAEDAHLAAGHPQSLVLGLADELGEPGRLGRFPHPLNQGRESTAVMTGKVTNFFSERS